MNNMNEEARELAGLLYFPGDPELVKIKRKAHILSQKYNLTFEDEIEKRSAIIMELFPDIAENFYIQGPIQIHYGVHTHIGKRFFGNFNLTIQDDTNVYIGDDCNFGPNVTIVTPCHPMVAAERKAIKTADGKERRLCWAKPVKIGNDCWFGANVVVCPGVTIGDGCVIGAGSVVTRDIPSCSFAAGNPCRVIRKISKEESIKFRTDLFGEQQFLFE